MGDREKDNQEGRLSMKEMENVTGGGFGNALWIKCGDAYSEKCPGRPLCKLFNTEDCVDGRYNPLALRW
jgi:hypothetical protein